MDHFKPWIVVVSVFCIVVADGFEGDVCAWIQQKLVDTAQECEERPGPAWMREEIVDLDEISLWEGPVSILGSSHPGGKEDWGFVKHDHIVIKLKGGHSFRVEKVRERVECGILRCKYALYTSGEGSHEGYKRRMNVNLKGARVRVHALIEILEAGGLVEFDLLSNNRWVYAYFTAEEVIKLCVKAGNLSAEESESVKDGLQDLREAYSEVLKAFSGVRFQKRFEIEIVKYWIKNHFKFWVEKNFDHVLLLLRGGSADRIQQKLVDTAQECEERPGPAWMREEIVDLDEISLWEGPVSILGSSYPGGKEKGWGFWKHDYIVIKLKGGHSFRVEKVSKAVECGILRCKYALYTSGEGSHEGYKRRMNVNLKGARVRVHALIEILEEGGRTEYALLSDNCWVYAYFTAEEVIKLCVKADNLSAEESESVKDGLQDLREAYSKVLKFFSGVRFQKRFEIEIVKYWIEDHFKFWIDKGLDLLLLLPEDSHSWMRQEFVSLAEISVWLRTGKAKSSRFWEYDYMVIKLASGASFVVENGAERVNRQTFRSNLIPYASGEAEAGDIYRVKVDLMGASVRVQRLRVIFEKEGWNHAYDIATAVVKLCVEAKNLEIEDRKALKYVVQTLEKVKPIMPGTAVRFMQVSFAKIRAISRIKDRHGPNPGWPPQARLQNTTSLYT